MTGLGIGALEEVLLQGRAADAAMLLSAVLRYFGIAPPFLAPADVAEYDRDIAACREQLGDAGFESAWAAGQAMTLEQACEIALRAWQLLS